MSDGFSNSVVGGAETLIRSAIKSVTYVANAAGWRIARDGSAEFNDVILRGELFVNGTDSSYIAVDKDIAGQPRIQMRPRNTTPPTTVNAGTILTDTEAHPTTVGVRRAYSEFGSPYLNVVLPYGFLRLYSSYSDGSGVREAVIGGILTNQEQLVSTVSDTASSAAISNVETVVLTLPSATYLAGRVYRITHTASFTPSIASTATPGRPLFRVRQTGLGGNIVQTFGRMLGITAEPYDINQIGYFQNAGSSDITSSLVLTMTSGSGAGVNDVVHVGTAVRPRQVEIHYVGKSDGTHYPNAPTVI